MADLHIRAKKSAEIRCIVRRGNETSSSRHVDCVSRACQKCKAEKNRRCNHIGRWTKLNHIIHPQNGWRSRKRKTTSRSQSAYGSFTRRRTTTTIRFIRFSDGSKRKSENSRKNNKTDAHQRNGGEGAPLTNVEKNQS